MPVVHVIPIPPCLHLVIGPYPQEYELHDETDEGLRLFVRPVKPEDAPLFVELFNVLSPTSIYYRFFSAVKSLSPAMLERFTQVDYDREIALVAVDETGDEKMVGVASSGFGKAAPVRLPPPASIRSCAQPRTTTRQ